MSPSRTRNQTRTHKYILRPTNSVTRLEKCPLFEFLTLKTASISLSWHKEKSMGQKTDMVITVAMMKQALFTPCWERECQPWPPGAGMFAQRYMHLDNTFWEKRQKITSSGLCTSKPSPQLQLNMLQINNRLAEGQQENRQTPDGYLSQWSRVQYSSLFYHSLDSPLRKCHMWTRHLVICYFFPYEWNFLMWNCHFFPPKFSNYQDSQLLMKHS